MSRIGTALLVLGCALWACKSEEPAPAPAAPPAAAAAPVPPPPPAPPLPSQAELVSGPLPGGPEAELARGRCLICHTEDYLVQQRLSPEAWKKTVAKMQKFGAPVSDEEVARIATWLGTLYTPQLPMRRAPLAELPATGLPSGS